MILQYKIIHIPVVGASCRQGSLGHVTRTMMSPRVRVLVHHGPEKLPFLAARDSWEMLPMINNQYGGEIMVNDLPEHVERWRTDVL